MKFETIAIHGGIVQIQRQKQLLFQSIKRLPMHLMIRNMALIYSI